MSIRRSLPIGILSLAMCLSACARRVSPPSGAASTPALEVREGLASYYGAAFHGKTTASGRRFDMNAMVAAHPSYPFGTVLRVTNLANRRQVRLRVVDRGPAAAPRADGVIIDVSRRAAEALGFIREGRARIRLEVLEWGRR